MHTLDIEVNISAKKKSANDIACMQTYKVRVSEVEITRQASHEQ